ncbi:MAG TPA: VOC family protein, partial [Micromonosporaceae bacterium]
QLAFPGEDISDRPLPSEVAPGLLELLFQRPKSGRYQLASLPGPSTAPIALWLTVEVDDHAAHHAFYADVLGLPEVDGWSIDGEVGTVFAAGPGGHIEIEHPAFPESATKGARAAVEYPTAAALAAVHDRIPAAPPITAHSRGHAGFTVHDPHGSEIYLWTEKWEAR